MFLVFLLVLSFVYILMTGDLISGINAFGENAYQSYGMVLVFSITGYFGMQAVLSLVRTFGAFVAVTVTSMRKAVSVVISFILFSKPFTIQYLVSFQLNTWWPNKFWMESCYNYK